MDHLLLMALALVGIIGWVWGYFRHFRTLMFGLLAFVAVASLGFYFFFELMRAEPEMYSGRAQVGWPILLLMAAGVCMLLSKTKPTPSDGDAQSA